MLSTIALAAARQARAVGSLPIRRVNHLAATTAIPSGFRVAAVFSRGYAEAPRKRGRSKKTNEAATPAAPKEKKTKTPPIVEKTKTGSYKAPVAYKALNAARKPKVLTEEEKTKLRIKDLKKAALLDKIPRLPTTVWTVYFTERTKAATHSRKRPGGAIGLSPYMKELVGGFAADYKTLSAEELERLRAVAEQNKLTNAVNFKNWLDSYTPQEINAANNARALLKRTYGITTKHQMHDPRMPKKRSASYVYYVKANWDAPRVADLTSQEKFKKFGIEWNELPADKRKPFEDMAEVDLSRYEKEMQTIEPGFLLPRSRLVETKGPKLY